MKLMIKIAVLALSLSTLVGVFTACRRGGGTGSDGTETQGNKKTITLTIWGAQEDQQMLKEM